jgi:hypothetical protein
MSAFGANCDLKSDLQQGPKAANNAWLRWLQKSSRPNKRETGLDWQSFHISEE